MRPLLLLRTYSGLDPAHWLPSGTPAISRLIEHLAGKGTEAVALFCDKYGDAEKPGLTKIANETFGRLTIYRYRSRWAVLSPRLAGILHTVSTLATAIRLIRRHRCGVIYADRVHLIEAALLACLGYRVVWRCLGAMPFSHQRNSPRLGHRLLYWLNRLALAAPIRSMICTRDGSPWWHFFPRRYACTRLMVEFNGVDFPTAPPTEVTVADPPHILFVNRMIANKHPLLLVTALSELKRQGFSFRATLIGYGPLEMAVRDSIVEAGLGDCTTLVGRVPNDRLPEIRANSDIAVVLNRGGQIGNTLLEALASGLCPVVFGADHASEIDVDTEAVLPRDVMSYVDRADAERSLTQVLAGLLSNPTEIRRRKQAAYTFAVTNLEGWSRRLELEAALITGNGSVEGTPGALSTQNPVNPS